MLITNPANPKYPSRKNRLKTCQHKIPSDLYLQIFGSTPSTLPEIQSVIAFCNYYRSIIPDFKHLMSTLFDILHDKDPLYWTSQRQSVLHSLKNCFTPHYDEHSTPT